MDLPKPMKAVTGELPADDDGWAYEIKWDGMRVVAGIDDGGLHAVSTRGLDVAPRFPELGPLAEGLRGHRVVLDGEVVAFEAGRADFSRLQHRMHVADPSEARRRAGTVPVAYVVFDLLQLDGHDTTVLPYLDRRRLLVDLVEPGPAWQVPAHRVGDGASLLAAAREQRLEGLMAKRLASRYEPGRRSPSWRKIKVRNRQEFVVGGWTAGAGGRSGHLGALLIGYHDPEVSPSADRLTFAGSVGTGFDRAELERLADLLAPLADTRCPFVDPLPPPVVRTASWIRPVLVVEVTFAEWTPDGRLRHPSYLGRRTDRDPGEVVRESFRPI